MAKAKPKAAVVQPKRSLAPLVLLLALWWLSQGGGGLPIIAPSGATAATYVYEKDQHAIPSAVLAGLNRLNREKKIIATALDVDTKDGTGEVPGQYKLPFAEAVKAGLPALVVTAGDKVLTVVKSPTTEEAVMEAVR